MAYIQKRGNSWQAQISWYDLQNKRRYKTKSVFLTKTAAKKWKWQNKIAKYLIKTQYLLITLNPGMKHTKHLVNLTVPKEGIKKFIASYKKFLAKPRYLRSDGFYIKIL